MFKEHLKKQLGFLERSCSSFDDGYFDEAIRISVVIRILIHDTHRSISLLKHLESKSINILSSIGDDKISEGCFSYFGLGIHELSVNPKYVPLLGNGPPISLVAEIDDWWNEVVYVIDGHRITRKKIVLNASNKDGGAHVDSKLDIEYETLSKDGAVGKFDYSINGQRKEHVFDNAHHVALRQMAYELLNSPELLALVNS